MWNAFVVRWFTMVGIFLTMVSVLPAQFVEPDTDWARAMIDKDMLNINYKSVARGQDVSFPIRVSNIYKEDMQITNLTTSCGCIAWDENKGGGLAAPILIPSGQSRFITLRLDTVRHHGEQRNKRGTITFLNTVNGIPGTATVVAEGYIRTDVVIQPGSVNFGSVDPEKPAEQRIAVNYAGRYDWRLISAKCSSPHLSVDVVEKSRANGAVSYELIVRLKETAPLGQLRDQLILVTDDANNPQIPVQVDARIESDITVSDANFGLVTPGKPKKIQVIARYTKVPVKAFKIEKFERTRQEDTIRVEKSSDAKPLHQLFLTFTPPDTPGPFEEEFYLTVSGREKPITFKARGRIQETSGESGLKQ